MVPYQQQILAQLTFSKAVSPSIPGDAWLWSFDSPGTRKRRGHPRCFFYLFTVRVTEHRHRLPRKLGRLHPCIYSKSDWPRSWQTSSTLPEQESSIWELGQCYLQSFPALRRKKRTSSGKYFPFTLSSQEHCSLSSWTCWNSAEQLLAIRGASERTEGEEDQDPQHQHWFVEISLCLCFQCLILSQRLLTLRCLFSISTAKQSSRTAHRYLTRFLPKGVPFL